MIVTDSLAGLEKAWGKVSVTMRVVRSVLADNFLLSTLTT
jgi:hypothetical protein